MRSPLALVGRYLPIGILAAAQIAAMVMAPSIAPAFAAGSAPGSFNPNAPGPGGTTGPVGTQTGPVGTQTGPGQNVPGTSNLGGRPAANSGDTTHCVAGREFSPAVAWFAPPCQPGTPGGADPNNGGATYRQGVTATQIEIVDYVTNYGAEINAILRAQKLLVDYEQEHALDQAVQNFMNKNFVMWGRKVHIDTWAGQCNFQDDNCILPEIDGVISRYHPYMMFWQTPVCPECFSEIAHDGTIAIGGLSFSREFAQANAPFFYNAGTTSTNIEEAFAEWWCSSMSSANEPSRVARFSADKNPKTPINGQKRVLGFISPNKPDDENTITNFLWPRLHQLCGEDPNTFHHYFYAQDINTAAQQVAATMAAMDTPTNYATDILCVCDVVAPEFLYQGEYSNNYWPENLVADTQGMGLDLAAQAYDANFTCPGGAGNCTFDDAIGIDGSPTQESQANDPGIRIWHQGCGCNSSLPSTSNGTVSGQSATDIFTQFVMMGSLIEASGPQLDPWTMAKAALNIPAIGGGNHPVLHFTNQGYSPWNWEQTARVAYYSTGATSSYNHLKGTWVSYPNDFGAWHSPGGYPNEPHGPNVQPANRRTS